MEKNSIVEIFCGNYPDSHVTPNIASNPNFVFENDPAFQGVQLYDEDGNVVTVNGCDGYALPSFLNRFDYQRPKNKWILYLKK